MFNNSLDSTSFSPEELIDPSQYEKHSASGESLDAIGVDTGSKTWVQKVVEILPTNRGLKLLKPHHSGYEREVVESVWEFAEEVRGVDAAIWRKDENGDWINRFDFGRRDSEFGWEIFDPGIGRHNQGVFAMRPLHWTSFLKQFDSFS